MARGRPRSRGRGQAAREHEEPEVNVNPIDGGVAENVGAAGIAAPAGADEPRVEAQQQQGPDRMDQMLGMMAQMLERLPAPAPAPVAPPVVHERPRVANPEVRENVMGPMIPSYLTVMDHMQRLGTKFFSGGAKPIEAEEWRSRLERNLLSVRCPEEYKVGLAVHYLDGDAHLWWRSVLERRPNGVDSWVGFCEEFNLKYFPPEAVDRLATEFLYLTQGNKSVREYEAEFVRLRQYSGRGLEDDQALVRRFLRGMRPELKKWCSTRTYPTVAELVERAAIIEESLEEEAKAAKSQAPAKRAYSDPGRGGKFAKGLKRKWEGSTQSASSIQTGCFKCGGKDHKAANCPNKDMRTCFYCKEVGHIKTSCPKLKQGEGTSGAPPAKRTAVTPRAYALTIESGEGSNTKPITG